MYSPVAENDFKKSNLSKICTLYILHHFVLCMHLISLHLLEEKYKLQRMAWNKSLLSR